MSAHGFNPEPHYAPKALPSAVVRAGQVLVAVGILSFVAGLATGRGTEVRIAMLTNIVYFFGVCMGGLIFSVAMTLTLARWGRPLKRIAESFVVYTPILWVLLAIFLFTGGLDLYEWHTDPSILHGHKAIWLTDSFFVVRVLGSTALLMLMAFIYLRHSLRPDLAIASKALGGKHPAWWGRLTQGWTDDESDAAESHHRMLYHSPLTAMLYAIIMSFFAFDVMMSLAPHWYANMFGGWFFCSCLWLGFIWTGLFSLRARKALGIEHLLTPAVYHDLGKLAFAFTLVWAYMFYAQLLPIWYGNMTEEIGFLLVRMTLEPWTYLTRIVGTMCFLIPFTTLLSRGLKKMPLGFFTILVIMATGVFLERFLLIAPSVWYEESIPFSIPELGVTLGFLGGFLWTVSRFLSQVPAVPVSDPYMQPNPEDVHVLPSAEAH